MCSSLRETPIPTKGASQHASYAEQVIELSADLSTILGNNYPSNIPSDPGDDDFDFGATPLLFQPSGCPPLVAAMNKSGMFELYDESSISSGPIQYIAMSVPTDDANFVGVPAYDPVTGYVYVELPSTEGIYQPGMAAFSLAANCTLNTTPVWSASFGPTATRGRGARSPISIANGVVYIGNYTGETDSRLTRRRARSYGRVAVDAWQRGTVIANGMVLSARPTESLPLWRPSFGSEVTQESRKERTNTVPRLDAAVALGDSLDERVHRLGSSGGRDQRGDEHRHAARRVPGPRTRIRVDERAADDDAVGVARDLAHVRGAAQAESDRERLAVSSRSIASWRFSGAISGARARPGHAEARDDVDEAARRAGDQPRALARRRRRDQQRHREGRRAAARRAAAPISSSATVGNDGARGAGAGGFAREALDPELIDWIEIREEQQRRAASRAAAHQREHVGEARAAGERARSRRPRSSDRRRADRCTGRRAR